jgi:excisionase family DNA binding protein
MTQRGFSNRVMSVQEVAHILGVHRTQVYKLANEERLPGAFRLGKRILISRTVFDSWLNNPNSV